MSLKGSQKLAILLCKFSDDTESEPNPKSFYQDMFVERGGGGLNDYWIAASLGSINLDGSHVFGWKTLDIGRSDFLAANPSRRDKINGAINAFGTDASKFAAVVAMFNVDVTDGGATGAGGGVLAQPQDANLTFLGHETGHVFGLEHSFDTSARIAVPQWPSAPGEYFDRQDIMSAKSVDSDTGHRFSPRGPLLNAANLDRMGWLPAARVWRPMENSSHSYDVDIVALEHPEAVGYLAAKTGGWIIEFRMADGFDSGLARPAILVHRASANPNSYIIASDAENNNHEWQPGQVIGSRRLFDLSGGTLVNVVSFDLQRKTARLRVQVKALKAPFADPDAIFGLGIGELVRDGILLILKDGKIVPVPSPQPDLRDMVRSELIELFKRDAGFR
jgi:hypothetical protein